MGSGEISIRPGPARVAAAWAVHVFTASGALWGLLGLVAVGQGRFGAAMGWMLVALVVDSMDGVLARLADVQRVLPGFDGALLDNIVDYVNYVLVPAYFIHAAERLPAAASLAAAAAICLASAYQFAQVEAKTADHAFTGFPSYWNLVAIYLLLLELPQSLALAVIVVLGVLCFVPIRYLYPSRTRGLRLLHLSVMAAWVAVLMYLVARWPEASPSLAWGSLVFGAYYFTVSLWQTFRSGTSR